MRTEWIQLAHGAQDEEPDLNPVQGSGDDIYLELAQNSEDFEIEEELPTDTGDEDTTDSDEEETEEEAAPPKKEAKKAKKDKKAKKAKKARKTADKDEE